MQLRGDSGDNIQSLSKKILLGTNITLEDIMTDEHQLHHTDKDSAYRDVAEQLIIDTTYDLLRQKKITKLQQDIFLHSHGLDEYYPKKTVAEITQIVKRRKIKLYKGYNLPQTIRIIRYQTSKKVRDEIVGINNEV